MKFLSSLSLLVFGVSAVVAAPAPAAESTPSTKALYNNKRGLVGNLLCTALGQCCLSDSQAQKIVDTFNYLLANPKASNFNSTVDALLADNYTEYSDSIDFIIHVPVSFLRFAPLLTKGKKGGGETSAFKKNFLLSF